MDRLLKAVQGRLARDRGERAFDLLGIEGQLVFQRGLLRHPLKDQHLAESGGQFGQGQCAVEVEQGLRTGQRGMDAMPQLMGQRHHVFHFAQIVEQDIGMNVGRDIGAERAAVFALRGRGVNPAFVEELPGPTPHFRRKVAESV